MNSRRCMISSFEVRTYSTTTLGRAQGCQLYGPNQEPKARSDYVLAQPSTLHASRRPVSLRLRRVCVIENGPVFMDTASLVQETVKLNLPPARRPMDRDHMPAHRIGAGRRRTL